MNTSIASESKAVFSFKDTLYKVVPGSVFGRILFWGALSPVLLLFTLGVSFLSASPFSIYLPFLTLLGGALCLRWKTLGLSGCYVALAFLLITHYQAIPPDERLWQMGIIFTLAVDFFVVLLASEEIEALIGGVAATLKTKTTEFNQSQLQLQQLGHDKDELQKSLDDEIERLKTEAEQRRIERVQECKQIELIHSEIELLNSQKASFVAEAKKAREVLEQNGQSQQIIQELEGRIAEISAQLNEAQASREALTEKLHGAEALKEQLASQTADRIQAESFKSENEALQARVQTLSESVSKSEGLQAKVVALTENLNQADIRTKEAILAAQLKIMTLQVSPVIKVDDRKIRHLEGLLKQLRKQFEEKADILNQTRKDLFHTHGKLLSLEHEQELREVDSVGDSTAFYEQMASELSSLEEEVELLEGLVAFKE